LWLSDEVHSAPRRRRGPDTKDLTAMRAIIVREFGDLSTLELGDMPEPTIGPDQVLLSVRATAANFVDLLVIGGQYQFLPKLPFVPGKGPAGVVVAVGAKVATLRVGDRVLAMAEQGGFGAAVAVAENQCYRLPPSMSFIDAAAISLVYDTSWFALRDRARIQPGETALVLGASGGVGYAAVQLAKAMGAKVLGGIATPSKADAVRAAGADVIIDLAPDNLRESLRAQVFAATEGRGADIVIDPLGGDIFDAALRAVAWCGRVVVVGFAAGRIPTLKVNYLMLKNIEVSGLQVSDYRKRRPEQVAACFREVFGLYERGAVRPAMATTLPLAQCAVALQRIKDRTAQGRMILVQDAE
jgi:NADPH:quinone reductase